MDKKCREELCDKPATYPDDRCDECHELHILRELRGSESRPQRNRSDDLRYRRKYKPLESEVN